MKIIALKYGEALFAESDIFRGGEKGKLLPISFVIYYIKDGEKNILVDVGCDDGSAFSMSVFKKPSEVLCDCGISPLDITDVVITHAHYDHIQAISHYKNATVHIRKEEYCVLGGQDYIPEDFKLNFVDEEYELSENVKIRHIGGHSQGSCIVIAGEFVLCGDECYHRKSLLEGVLPGVVYDEAKSKSFLEEYGKEKYKTLLFHDPEILKRKLGFEEISV